MGSISRRARRRAVMAALAAIGLLSRADSASATSYWDANGATAGAGGATPSGFWGASAFWSSSSAGTAATGGWTSGDTAVFSAGTDATGNFTVNVSGTQTVAGLTLEEGTLTLSNSGGALSLSGTSATFNIQSSSATINVPIGGTSALSKSGTGSLVLGVANSYGGGTTISAGTLQMNNTSALGSGNITLGGGMLLHNFTDPFAHFGKTLTMTTPTTFGVTPGNQVNFWGTLVGGSNALTVNGGGLFFLGEPSGGTVSGLSSISITGNTTMGSDTNAAGWGGTAGVPGSGPSVNVGAGSSIGVNNAVVMPNPIVLNGTTGGSGAIFAYSPGGGFSGPITLNGTTNDIGGVSDFTLSGAISGTGGLTKLGNCTVTLSGAQSYSGSTTLAGGTLLYDVNGSGVLSSMTAPSAIGATSGHQYSFTNPSQNFNGGGNALTVTGGGKLYLGGVSNTVTNLSSITVSNNSTVGGVSWGGAATPVIVQAGSRLELAGQGVVMPNAVTLNGTTGGNGAIYANATFGGGISGAITLNGTTNDIGGNFDFTLSGAISGTGGLNKIGNCALTLSGTQSYSGPTTLAGGTLIYSNNGPPHASSCSMTAPNAIGANSGQTCFFTPATFNGGGNALTITGGGKTYLGGTTGSVTNLSSITVTGNSTLGGVSWSGAGTPVIVGGGSRLELYGENIVLPNPVTLNGTTGGNGAIYVGTDGMVGGGGISGAITLNGTTNDIGGARDFTLSGAISGAGGLNKIGVCTLTLSGSQSSYSGPVSLAGGTLLYDVNGTATANSMTAPCTIGVTSGHQFHVNSVFNGTFNGGGNALTVAGGGKLYLGSGSGNVTNFSSINVTGNSTLAGADWGDPTTPVTVQSGSRLELFGEGLVLPNPITLYGTTGGSGAIYVGADGSFGFGGLSGSILLLGTCEVGGTRDFTLSGNIAGSGGLTKIGNCTLTLSGSQTLGGPISLAGGTLLFDVNGSDYFSTMTAPSTISVTSGKQFTVQAYSGSFNGGGNALTVGAGGKLYLGTLSNTVSNFSSITVTGNTTLAGVSWGNSVPVIVQNGSQLELRGDGIVMSNPVTLGNSSVSVGTDGTTGGGGLSGAMTLNGIGSIGGSRDFTLSGTIGGAGALTKTGSCTLTLTNSVSYTGATQVNAGKLSLVSLLNSSSVLVGSGATLELAAGAGGTRVIRTTSITTPLGKLDLQDNKLIVTNANSTGSWNGSAYTGLTQVIATGRNGNTVPLWDGNGIVTSQTVATSGNLHSIGIARASDVRPATATATGLWAGQTITGTDTLVMYTYGGDATLDGKLNVDDYIKIDSGIASALTGWVNGDFNYDGKINIDDYTTVIDANIGNQSGVFPTAGGGESVTAVPEPAGLGLALGWVALLARRRRRR